MPDSITIGSYENLRMFKISRFEMSEGKSMRAPNARLYSSKLLQWLDYNYIDSMKSLVANYDSFFDDTNYKPLMLSVGEFKNQKYSWHFSKSEIYKHYFEVFYSQIKNLSSNQQERIEQLKSTIKIAIDNFTKYFNIKIVRINYHTFYTSFFIYFMIYLRQWIILYKYGIMF